ncbi:hypothetical protein HY745_03900 [Candidatus Desantisbacteria bacterium]|nr:hypothetical protein [Candidatus Desantisbacteria bacterium]
MLKFARYFASLLILCFLGGFISIYALEDGNELEKGNVMHTPVKKQVCLDCHSAHTADPEANAILKRPKQVLCKICHSEIFEGNWMHLPIKKGDCGCHNAHRAPYKYNLRTDPEDAKLCYACHSKKNGKKFAHPPVEEGRCTACHSPHGTDYQYQLRKETKELCMSCHIKFKDFFKQNPKWHPVLNEGHCSNCHDPHGSDEYRYFLRGNLSDKHLNVFTLKAFEFCFICHDYRLATEQVTTNATGFRSGKRNLHFAHVNKKTLSGKNCLACHDPHGSDQNKLIRRRRKFGEYDYTIDFYKTSDGGKCHVGCHSDQEYIRNK